MTDLSGVFTNTFTNGTLADATEVNANLQDVLDFLNGDYNSYTKTAPILSPIGSIVAWHKTFGSADSGTTDGTTANKLVQSGQNFDVTVLVGMIVHNTTDDTFANVTAVDSATTLSLSADIMISGENFIIYKTPQLPDGWVECDGSAISDADSPYNGVTLPNLNQAVEQTHGYFLRGRGSGTTGQTETSQVKAHIHSINTDGTGAFAHGSYVSSGSANTTTRNTNSTGGTEGRPASFIIVWIMRIK